MEINPQEISTRERYQLLTGSLLPRPIAFVSTQNRAGETNLAPFSFFNGVSSNPPCISIAIARNRDGSKKDTLINIEETKEFVVNGASIAMSEALVETAASYPYGESEIETCGFTPVPAVRVSPPRIAEALMHYECRLLQTVTIGDGSPGSSTLVIGEIVQMHFEDSIFHDGRITLESLNPLSRLGGDDYASSTLVLSKAIPRLEKKR